MSWDNILGQERIKLILSNAIKNNRISSSYLFTGIEGIGKDHIAIEFAKIVNCENNFTKNDIIYSCDKCKSCITFDNLSNDNLILIYSLPTVKSNSKSDDPIQNLDEKQLFELKSQLNLKIENKYHKINLTGANNIKVNSIRDLKKKLSFASSNAGRKFIIILNAEEMTSEASNAFLKTLEEPNDNITIILVTSTPEVILQTIKSRCQEIIFAPIENSSIVDHLINKYNKSREEANLISNFAQGSISKCSDFIDEDIQNLRSEIVELLRTTVKRKYKIELMGQIESMTAAKDKHKVEIALKLLIIWLRDVEIFIRTEEQNLIINQDQIEIISKFSKVFQNANYNALIIEIEKTITMIFQNVSLNIALTSLFIRIRENLLGNIE